MHSTICLLSLYTWNAGMSNTDTNSCFSIPSSKNKKIVTTCSKIEGLHYRVYLLFVVGGRALKITASSDLIRFMTLPQASSPVQDR